VFRFFETLAILILIILTSESANAQNYLGQIGAPAFSTASPVELGYLNIANGNLHLSVPLGSFPQRGHLDYTAALDYDSSIWVEAGSVPPSWQPTNVSNSWGGWRLVISASPGTASFLGINQLCDTPPPYHSYTIYDYFQWRAPDGTLHDFSGIQTERDPQDCDQGNTASASGFATDASGYFMVVTNYSTISAVYAPDGTQVYPTVKDTNGNFFSADANGNVVDTLGRTPVTTTTNGSTITYQVLDSQGSSSPFVVTTQSITVSTAFHKSGVTEYSGALTVIHMMTLPDGSSYQFGYDSYGLLNSITLPTGATVTYGAANFTDAFSNISRWITSRVSGGGTWTYTPAVVASCNVEGPNCQQQVTIVKPSGDTEIYSYVMDNGGWSSQIAYYTGGVSSSNLAATSSTSWNFANGCQGSGCTGNQNIQKMTTTLTVPLPGSGGLTGGSASQTKQYTYSSATNSNVTKLQEWNFYRGVPGTLPDRETDFSYVTASGYTGKNIIDLPSSSLVCVPVGNPPTCTGSTTILGQTIFTYDQGTPTAVSGVTHHDDTNFGVGDTVRGNLTQTQYLVSGTSNYLSMSRTYDTTGQMRSVIDSAQNSTLFSYADNFFTDNGNSPPSSYSPSAPTNAYLTQTTLPIIGATAIGYYFNTGKRALTTDPNAVTAYFHYVDPLDRLTGVNYPIGWALTSFPTFTQTHTYVGISSATASSSCTSCRHDQANADGLGRTISKIQVNDPDGASEVDYSFDANGRLGSTTNPYRGSSTGQETISYDGLDRPTKVMKADGNSVAIYYGPAVNGAGLGGIVSSLCSSSYGIGYPVLAIDESGHKHESWIDGFGRTIEVDEPDATGALTSPTCYTYDLNDDLTASAHGSQVRTYQYDLLSRMTSQSLPETGGVAATFAFTRSGTPCSGNIHAICQSTDPRGVITNLYYDQLSRLTKKTHSDSTPTTTYSFDAGSYGKGRQTAMTDGSGSTTWTYDADGRVRTEQRTLAGITKTITYSYTLDGSLSSVVYPSGHTINYSVGNAERQTAIVDSTSGINYVGSLSGQSLYSPTGAPATLLLGKTGTFGGITSSFTYNNRMQLNIEQTTSSNGTPMNLSFCFYQLQSGNACPAQSSGNNGNVVGVVNNADGTRTQALTYDSLNRISTAQSQATSGQTCWGLSFGIDAIANLTSESVTKCSSLPLSLSINSYNQISNSGFHYDASGNLISDGLYQYSYDAEGRMISASGMSGGPYCYSYDGGGFRVLKSNANGALCSQATVDVIYWRDIAGNTVAETDSSGSTTNQNYHEYIFLAGKRIAQRDGLGNVHFYFSDRLGSTQVITDSQGNKCYDTDYLPFGVEVGPYTNTCPDHYKFAGYERDSETGLDYAVARYYDSHLGRFLSPDPLAGGVSSPQSLNRYTYVENNCANLVDPLGMSPDCGVIIGGATQTPDTPTTKEENNLANFNGAVQAYPYSGLDAFDSEDRFLSQGKGAVTDSTRTAVNAITYAAESQPGPIYILTFSAGASAYLSARPLLPLSVLSRIQNVTYLSPVSPELPLQPGTGHNAAYFGTDGTDDALKAMYLTDTNGIPTHTVDCGHEANCEISALAEDLIRYLGGPCPILSIFIRGGSGAHAFGDGWLFFGDEPTWGPEGSWYLGSWIYAPIPVRGPVQRVL